MLRIKVSNISRVPKTNFESINHIYSKRFSKDNLFQLFQNNLSRVFYMLVCSKVVEHVFISFGKAIMNASFSEKKY